MPSVYVSSILRTVVEDVVMVELLKWEDQSLARQTRIRAEFEEDSRISE